MKTVLKISTILILFFFVASCNNGMNINQLQNEVLKEIEAKIENQGQDIQVKSFVLTYVSGNEYTGVLETLESGQVYTYNVNVISDGNSFVWEIPPSQMSHDETETQTNSDDTYSDDSYEETDTYQEEDHKNMVDVMENISDPTFCSLCKGTGIEENRARGTGMGDDEYGRICPMCNGTGKRSY